MASTPKFTVRGILLDIEGTTSSIRFVYDVMFPYVRERLDEVLREDWGEADVQESLKQMAADEGHAGVDQWLGDGTGEELYARVKRHVLALMDRDAKSTGLKLLQGLVWKAGFHSGKLVGHVYPDVEPALRVWKNSGCKICIYSSGSVAAQKLFFGHTIEGDLLNYFDGFYDTTIGPKKTHQSYLTIADDMQLPPEFLLFASDSVDELRAAVTAGFEVVHICRRENPPIPTPPGMPHAESFSELQIDVP